MPEHEESRPPRTSRPNDGHCRRPAARTDRHFDPIARSRCLCPTAAGPGWPLVHGVGPLLSGGRPRSSSHCPGRVGGLGRRASGQADTPGEEAGAAGDDRVVWVVEHHRQRDPGRREARRVGFDEACDHAWWRDLGEQGRCRCERPDRVECANGSRRGAPFEECGKVTNVDDLHRSRGVPDNHVAALGHPSHPIREAVLRVVRSADIGRTDDCDVAEASRCCPFARRLQRSVEDGHVLGLVGGIVVERRVLVHRRSSRVIGRHRRHVHVVATSGSEHVGQLVDVAGHVGTDVDHRIPTLAAIDGGVVTRVAVTEAMLDTVSEQPRIGPPPMEHRHRVALAQRPLHRVPSHERCPTDEQQPHDPPIRRPRRQRTFPRTVAVGGRHPHRRRTPPSTSDQDATGHPTRNEANRPSSAPDRQACLLATSPPDA